MAEVDSLNGYQRQFIEGHCLGLSLCEGDVFLEMREDPQAMFIKPQIVGADFRQAIEADVLGSLRH